MAEVQSSVYLLGYKLYVLFLEFTFKVKQDEVLYQKKMNTNECFRGTKEVGVQELSWNAFNWFMVTFVAVFVVNICFSPVDLKFRPYPLLVLIIMESVSAC